MSQMVSGFVFERKEATENRGLKGVAVSNGRVVTLTDENGFYELPIHENTIVFISKPSGYDLYQDDNNQPKYYYLHYPEGSSQEVPFNYPVIEPTGPLPTAVNFYLKPSKGNEEQFSTIIMGDIQPKTAQEVGYFRDLFTNELFQQQADFISPLGDLCWDDLSLYPLIKKGLKNIDKPYFPVFGNHDMNLKAPDKAYTSETFRKYFGPPYYSFNYGKVHFVVLEDIGYSGWSDEENEKGQTFGWLEEQQLDWLANDLAVVPEDQLVFIMSHIPIYTHTAADNPYRNIQNRQALFDILKLRKKLFAVSAHTHCIEHVDLCNGGWTGETPFQALIAGAACGAWWKGPLDFDNIPVRMAMDGAPNGYFKFEFDGAEFSYQFFPVGQSSYKQMAIRKPSGDMALDNLPEEIVVNIFAASPDAKVSFQINDGAEWPMKGLTGQDPYVSAFLEKYRSMYPEWMRARITNHLWTAPWPKLTEPGVYTIQVNVEGLNGDQIKHRESFRILEEKQQNIKPLEKLIKALSN